ncbi:hypothetical protein GGX14DRAFT_658553 [Mycena pura]|uniref:Uncharacterized protein n=1 Tax=Mycena pura TaxID=153505 RepID=A0AAD6YMT1_9AGAR|nr:hypothetical protein GGX14DRAFT_658553 [Mycena pura]
MGQTWILATNVPGCTYAVSKQSALRMAGAWEADFVCDLLVFGFTVVRAYRQPVKLPGSILSHMLRDGAVYFAALALVNLANVLMYYLGNQWIASSLSRFTSSISVTLVSRLMLHIRKVADDELATSHSVHTALQFQTRAPGVAHWDEESAVSGEV